MTINLEQMAQDPADYGVLPTERRHKLTVPGEGAQEFRVCSIKLGLLKYNEQNDRIATFISQYRAENGPDALDNLSQDNFNEVIEGFIEKSNPEALKKNSQQYQAQDSGATRRRSSQRHHHRWQQALYLPASAGSHGFEILNLRCRHSAKRHENRPETNQST